MSENVKPSKSGKFLTQEDWDALSAMGYTDEELLADQSHGPMIFSYTRKQAIEDGVLVDVTDLARRAGFKVHTVITSGVLGEITQSVQDDGLKKLLVLGVLDALGKAIRLPGNRDTDRIFFTAFLNTGAECKLWSLIGPGDEGEPVLTIMLEGED